MNERDRRSPRVTVWQGMMVKGQLLSGWCGRGRIHYVSPDRHIRGAAVDDQVGGEAEGTVTTGVLISIGRTRSGAHRLADAIHDLHRRHGHIQEVIVQNFRAKPDTKLAKAPEPDLDDLCGPSPRRVLNRARHECAGAAQSDDQRRSKLIDTGIRRLRQRLAGHA